LKRLFIALLALLSQPTMLLNPFLGFRSREKVAEVTRTVSWPRHFDAPLVPLHDRPQGFRSQRAHDADNAAHLGEILASLLASTAFHTNGLSKPDAQSAKWKYDPG